VPELLERYCGLGLLLSKIRSTTILYALGTSSAYYGRGWHRIVAIDALLCHLRSPERHGFQIRCRKANWALKMATTEMLDPAVTTEESDNFGSADMTVPHNAVQTMPLTYFTDKFPFRTLQHLLQRPHRLHTIRPGRGST
jgi:hypothetical protein